MAFSKILTRCTAIVGRVHRALVGDNRGVAERTRGKSWRANIYSITERLTIRMVPATDGGATLYYTPHGRGRFASVGETAAEL